MVPFRPAAKTTIASWLVLILKEAGMSDYAGSTRAAAATLSACRGISSSTIMAAADWTSVKTMNEYYMRLLPEEALNTKPSVQDATLSL